MTPLAAMFVGAALTVLSPLVLWAVAVRRTGLGRHGWAAIGFGCLFFIVAQLAGGALRLASLALGVRAGPTEIVAFALIAGLTHESARFLAMRHVGQIRELLDRRSAAIYGLGHGGFGALALGLWMLANAFAIRNIDPATEMDAPAAFIQAAEQLQYTSPLRLLAAPIEHLIVILQHVGLSLIVARAVLAGEPRLLLLAMLVHAGANAGALALQQTVGNLFLTEGWLLLVAAGALYYGAGTRDSSDRERVEDPAVASAGGRS